MNEPHQDTARSPAVAQAAQLGVMAAWPVARRRPGHEETFTPRPTSASWLNAVETFFVKLTRRLKRGIFQSVNDLKAAINRFVAETNANPKPFVWKQALESVDSHVRRFKCQARKSVARFRASQNGRS
jgi:hypothetical protein